MPQDYPAAPPKIAKNQPRHQHGYGPHLHPKGLRQIARSFANGGDDQVFEPEGLKDCSVESAGSAIFASHKDAIVRDHRGPLFFMGKTYMAKAGTGSELLASLVFPDSEMQRTIAMLAPTAVEQ